MLTRGRIAGAGDFLSRFQQANPSARGPRCKFPRLLCSFTNIELFFFGGGLAAPAFTTLLPPLPPSPPTPVRTSSRQATPISRASSQQATPIRGTGSSRQNPSRHLTPQPSTVSRSQSGSEDPPTGPVYQHIRRLDGIIRTISRPPDFATDDDQSIPKLGPATDSYLSAHGYTIGAISQIEHAFDIHLTSQAFINYLSSRGMPWREAEYVWGLLQKDIE
jgi:hypothetical protein